jgi:glycosyltransferase involved in cell wall biosynthesis
VHFPGYASGENYVGLLKAFDVKVFLVPGSDGTCRAVREAMAMGKPAIVSDRGMLPEIVTDGEDGYVCDGSAQSVYDALARLATDRPLRHALGRAARHKAVTQYSLAVQAMAVLGVYERVMSRRKPVGITPT